jgi:hypothetical protein
MMKFHLDNFPIFYVKITNELLGGGAQALWSTSWVVRCIIFNCFFMECLLYEPISLVFISFSYSKFYMLFIQFTNVH